MTASISYSQNDTLSRIDSLHHILRECERTNRVLDSSINRHTFKDGMINDLLVNEGRLKVAVMKYEENDNNYSKALVKSGRQLDLKDQEIKKHKGDKRKIALAGVSGWVLLFICIL